MRHKVKKIRIGRDKDHTTMMVRNLVTSLVLHEKVQTTKKRAKALVSAASSAITMVKKNSDLDAIRRLGKYVTTEAASRKMLKEIKERFASVQSGYIRMREVGNRVGDDAQQYVVEFVGGAVKAQEPATESAATKKAPKKAAAPKKAQPKVIKA